MYLKNLKNENTLDSIVFISYTGNNYSWNRSNKILHKYNIILHYYFFFDNFFNHSLFTLKINYMKQTYWKFVIMAIFIALAFVLFAQQGHGDGTPDTFFFIHKTILGIACLIITTILGFMFIKIPKQK